MKPDLKAIKERAEKATPWPWETDEGRKGMIYCNDELGSAVASAGMKFAIGISEEEKLFNAEFIAHARQDIPALLSYIADLEAVAGAAKEEFNRSGCASENCIYCTSNCGHKELGKAIAKLDGDGHGA